MQLFKFNFGRLLLATLTAAALSACGGGGSTTATPASSTNTNTYQGAGSAWTLASKSDGTCTLSESDSNLKVNATCATLGSGFTKITVTSATGGNANLAAPAVGTVTYGYEISGYMMPFIAFSENKVVPTVLAGTCSSSLNHNFIVSFANLGTGTDFTGWAQMGNYTISNGNLSLHRYKGGGTFLGNTNMAVNLNTCSNGSWQTTTNGELTQMYLTQNGGAIFYRNASNSAPVQNGASTENNFMLPVANDVATLAGLDSSYIGFVITSQGAGNYTTKPVSVTAVNGAFAVSVRSGSDLATSTAGHSNFTLNSVKVSPSLYKGSLTHTNAGGAIGCAINANIANQKIVICSGIDPADTTNKTLYSLILKSN